MTRILLCEEDQLLIVEAQINQKFHISDEYLNHIVKRLGYNLNHRKDNIQDQENLIFQEMIRNIEMNQSKRKEVYTM